MASGPPRADPCDPQQQVEPPCDVESNRGSKRRILGRICSCRNSRARVGRRDVGLPLVRGQDLHGGVDEGNRTRRIPQISGAGSVGGSVSAAIQRVAETRTAAPCLCQNGGGPRGLSHAGVVLSHNHRVELCLQGSVSQEEQNVRQLDPSRPWGGQGLEQSRIPTHDVPQAAFAKMQASGLGLSVVSSGTLTQIPPTLSVTCIWSCWRLGERL
ncbi:uncharacterized protein LOC118215588 [Anguilla anguilla]|uniref:uncharacterized protein LOC118215588 n=1 Tax=Anguilla anguilla TaxID=7936 RepID=UPI0015B11462|nr:uncharacterized protein LOC118215588 [Anguilla anguilla]